MALVLIFLISTLGQLGQALKNKLLGVTGQITGVNWAQLRGRERRRDGRAPVARAYADASVVPKDGR